MSVVAYNGVTLPFCNTISFRNELVRDEDSRTDVMCNKFDIQVMCVITQDVIDLLCPELTGRISNPADIMSAVHNRLMKDRKQLSFQFNGVELIPQRAGVQGYVDAKNGPQPQSCVYHELNNTTWMMTYHIVAHYRVQYDDPVDLPEGGGVTFTNLPGNVVLSNRWEERVDIDRNQYSTRTRTGKIIIRSDNERGLVPDEVRSQMAVLSVPATFVRESSSYTVTKDGLGLQYEIKDREVYRMPPDPKVTSAEGYYFEESTRGDAQTFGTVYIRLEGPKYKKQAELIELAAQLCASKMHLQGAKFDLDAGNLTERGFLEHASLKVGLYDNWVECMMRVRFGAKPKRKGGVASWPNKNTPYLHGSDGQTPSQVVYDRGSAGLLLRAAAYYDPSFQDTQLGPVAGGGQFSPVNPETPKNKAQLTRGKQPGQAGAQGDE